MNYRTKRPLLLRIASKLKRCALRLLAVRRENAAA